MLSIWRKLFEHYKAYHAYGPPRLKYMGYVGGISLMLFYFLRFARPNPQPYDDLALRLVAIVLYALLALQDQWPEKLKPYYIGYSYFALLYCLPCFTVLVALQRGGGVPSISNTFIILCFLVLLTDWRNTLAMLAAGVGLATAAYMATTADPTVPTDLLRQLPAYALIIIGGNLFKFSTEQIDTERKLRATQALAGSIAHEIRHPLSQLKHSLENMQQALPAPTQAAGLQTLDTAAIDELYRQLAHSELAVKRGLQVISMTLDEVSARPMDTSKFVYLSAAQACEKAVQEYGYDSEAARAKVSVLVKEDFTFRCDETAFLFVLFNLIKNALYYTASHPQLTLAITVGEQQVKVRDTGPGIPPQALPRLFEPFRTLGKAGGTGLGLAYCQRVMHAFGGQIACKSQLGRFTEFTMAFPPISAQQQQAYEQAVLARAHAAFDGRRLLLVDDDAAIRAATRYKLEPLGATMDEAADGRRALEMLAVGRYDLVVLDLNMPGLDGYAVAQRIRQGQVPANRDVCIVAHTSETAHLASVKTHKAGMDGFVGKPCAQLPLVQALLHALEHPVARDRPETAGLAGRRVLLADDHPSNRRAVAAYLRLAGVQVTEADHGQAVIEQLRADGWDAILMDINMPGMSGLEAARAIRAGSAACRDVPIIALTAHSDQATVADARAAGMNGFLTKPVGAAALYATLRQFTAQGSGPAAAPLLMAPSYGPASGDGSDAVLDVDRLESYRRMGMLQELLGDYLPEIARLVLRLEQGVARQDLQESLDALHSLLGMSGEAGALALYRMARRIYVPMLESRGWPQQPGWLEQLKALAVQTRQALTAYGALQPQDQAA